MDAARRGLEKMVALAKVPTVRFGEKLVTILERRGVRQNDLAAQIGRVQSRISKWVNGTGHPTPRDVLRISKALGVSLRYLCDETLEDFALSQVVDEPAATTGLSTREQIVYGLIRELGIDVAFQRLSATPGAAEPHIPAPAPPAAASPQFRPAVGPPTLFPPAREPAKAQSKTAPRSKSKPRPKRDGAGAGGRGKK